jgi:L,D-transpeptidase YbiS
MADGKIILVVDVGRQRLTMMLRSRVLKSYRVSTSRHGLGERSGSGRTPRGWHRVVRWIGEGAPAGMVFLSRRATGRVIAVGGSGSGGGADLIVSRILRLRGLEPGRNAGPGVDSYARYIYIHGTNQEHLLGRPASHGCIRMASRDVMDLFRRTRGHSTYCWIGQDPGLMRRAFRTGPASGAMRIRGRHGAGGSIPGR